MASRFILKFKIKRNGWLLADTCMQAANHLIYFEVENELKFYNLKPWSQYLESMTQYCESGKSCFSPTTAVVARKHNAGTMIIANIRLDYCVCELYTNAIHIITRRVGNRKFIYYAFLSASYVTSLKCYSYKYHFD